MRDQVNCDVQPITHTEADTNTDADADTQNDRVTEGRKDIRTLTQGPGHHQMCPPSQPARVQW